MDAASDIKDSTAAGSGSGTAAATAAAAAPAAAARVQVGPSLPPEALALAARLFNAAREGDFKLLEQALGAGLPANMMNEKGDTLLMLAAYHGQADIVNLLLQHGADPNRLNDRGQSPLAGAVFKMEDAVVEALLEGGADPEYGVPSPLASIGIFNQEAKWRDKFEAAPGRGKAVAKAA